MTKPQRAMALRFHPQEPTRRSAPDGHLHGGAASEQAVIRDDDKSRDSASLERARPFTASAPSVVLSEQVARVVSVV
jgi:hypothetical protein